MWEKTKNENKENTKEEEEEGEEKQTKIKQACERQGHRKKKKN